MTEFYWTQNVEEAKREQATLSQLVETNRSDFKLSEFKTGLAIGTAYEENTKTAFAVCVTFDEKGSTISRYNIAKKEVDFEYKPGLLIFRIGPAICLVLDKIPEIVRKVDFLLLDGQGIAHPVTFGMASHIGLLFNKPSIGVTRKALFGNYSLPPRNNCTEVKHPKTKAVIGYCVSTGREPFYISPGHKITPSQSLEVIKKISGRGYLPNPLKLVHERANKLAKEYWMQWKKEKKYSL